MLRCPNCKYILVLLSHRRKYKCAKCSRLFLQNIIENEDFQRWNKFQRECDRQSLKKKIIKLTDEERKQKIKEYRFKNKEKIKQSSLAYRQRTRAEASERERIWRENNRERYNARKLNYYHKNSVRLNARKRELQKLNPEKHTLFTKIKKWREKQKRIALRMLENREYKAQNDKIFSSLPTKLLSYLLTI